MAAASRKASLQTPKIIVDDLEAKTKLLDICALTGENMREVIARLIDAEYKKVKGVK